MRLIETRPVVREAVIKFLCNRVREADHQLEGIALYPIEVRLARFFLAAARQKGELKPGSQGRARPADLAERAGAADRRQPAKVNAALALLEDGGAIERNEGRFTCDIEELEDDRRA